MFCRLCLCQPQILIPVLDESGTESSEIVATVERFLGLRLTIANRVCVTCWASVDNFRKFCALVTERQTQFTLSDEPLDSEQSYQRILTAASHVDPSISKHPELSILCNGAEAELQTNAIDGIERAAIAVQNSELYENSQNLNVSSVSDETQQKLITSSNTAGLKSETETENNYNVEISNSANNVLEKEQLRTGTVEKCLEPALADKPSSRQILRLANARKLGRPRRCDSNASLEEDRLIASHMQLCCDICTVNIPNFDALKRHFRTAHDVNGYAVCCKKRLYKRGVLIDHINVHRDPAYFTCSFCKSTFSDRLCLRNHVLLKHNDSEDSPYQCVHCSRRFAKLYFLQRHMMKHVDTTKNKFSCEHCQKSYPNSSRLRCHIRNVHSDISLKVCNYCGEIVRGFKKFQGHLKRHGETTAVSGVQCKVCKQLLSSDYCLRIHMERHIDKQQYVCTICGKDAPSRVALNAHTRYYHQANEKFHECGICQSNFKTKRGLREHMTTHTGEALYSCNYCGKHFKCSSNLHAHRKWQHAAEWTRDKKSVTSNVNV